MVSPPFPRSREGRRERGERPRRIQTRNEAAQADFRAREPGSDAVLPLPPADCVTLGRRCLKASVYPFVNSSPHPDFSFSCQSDVNREERSVGRIKEEMRPCRVNVRRGSTSCLRRIPLPGQHGRRPPCRVCRFCFGGRGWEGGTRRGGGAAQVQGRPPLPPCPLPAGSHFLRLPVNPLTIL